MKKVKITGTTYGHHVNGKLEPKNRKSDPFYLEDAEADRLALLGVAEIVGEGVAMRANDEKKATAGENSPKGESRAEDAESAAGDDDIPYTERPEYSDRSNTNVLREIAKNVGIKFLVGTTKAEMNAQLDAFFDEYFADSLDLAAAEPLE